jgi:urease accessory protein
MLIHAEELTSATIGDRPPGRAPRPGPIQVGKPDSATWDRAQRLGNHAAELAAFQDEPAQMRSGTVGKNGFLHLTFSPRGDRTAMVDVERRVPFMVQRALYWDQGLPEMACVYLLTTAGGVLQGDRYSMEVEVEANACAHLTTQSANKIQSMDANYAVQTQTLRLQDNAYLEFMPEPIIPYRRSRFLMDTHIEMAPSASLLYSEILLPGRRYHHPDEYFGFDVLSSNTRAFDLAGKELFCEKYVLEPGQRPLRRIGVMQDFDVYGNVLLLAPKDRADEVMARMDASFDAALPLAYGVSRLPNDAGLVFKVLGAEVKPVKAKIREFWSIARRVIKDAELPAPFLWR